MRILLIDHYDSFTRNLEHLFATALQAQVDVIAHDSFGMKWENTSDNYDLTVLSPGPGHPDEYTGYGPLLRSGKPVFGVCLGMQIINRVFGGATARLADCVHGKTDEIVWNSRQYTVARYHSLHLSRVPQCFDVLASNGQGVPMMIAHKDLPVRAVQFHPESFLTPDGDVFARFGAFLDFMKESSVE
jgi:para-aminobenzoate synthetase component 2